MRNFEGMKRILSLFLFLSLTISATKANINLVLDYSVFYLSDQDQPFVEFYLSINGNSLFYSSEDSLHEQASVEITYLIEEGEKVVAFEKFRLNSPVYNSGDKKLDLVDLKRISIPNGDYTYTLIARDLVSGRSVESSDQMRTVNFNKESASVSEVQLSTAVVAANESSIFDKNGYDIFPSFTHFYGLDQNDLYFYFEIYNSDKSLGENQDFLLEYSVISPNDGAIIANLRSFKRMKSAPVIPIIQSFNLNDLPTGKYELSVNVKNRENEVIASRSTEFHRSNPGLKNYSAIRTENTFVDSLTNKEELAEYIRCLAPISSGDEIQYAKNQVNYGDLKMMQQYFLNFWKERDLLNPAQAWFDYKKEVEKVDELFGYGNIKGYQTERGRVYLQYGPPSAMQNVPYQRDTYPYSIWQYYKLDGQVNRRFVFYSPSMEMLGYQVLHSNVRGEINNPNWEQNLYKDNGPYNTTIENPNNVTIQEEAKDLYDNPR